MERKITIGLFVDSFYPMLDGVVSVVNNYAKRLTKYANVIVFAPRYHGKDYDDSVFSYKVVRCMSLNFPFIDYSLPAPRLDIGFEKELNNYNLDIVHIHSPFTVGMAGVNYAKKHNIPVIGTMHSQFKQDFQRAVKSNKLSTVLNNRIIKVFDKCDECWAVNDEVARIFYEEYGYKTMPKVMNNATEMLQVEDDKKAKELINKKHNLNKEDNVFLFVGRLNKLKNIFLIVDSLKIIKETNPDFKFKMLYVGSGQDEEKLKNLIKKNKLENEIILCGRVTDRELLADYYARADLFLFPSLYDASSIVQIEAASQKTPTVFVEGAATTATIKDNINGFIAQNDKKAYANKIIEIMENKELYNNACENAYNQIYVNWDKQIEEVYNNYIEKINQ